MALPDLSDIRVEVRRRLGLSTNDTAITDTILTSLINAAIRKVNLLHDWPWLVTTDATLTATVDGTRIYTPASDYRRTLFLIAGTDQQLRPKQPQDIWRFAEQEGHPMFYAVQGGQIILAPTPDAVYTLTHVYIKDDTTELSSDTDEPSVPLWALDLIIEKAAVLGARRLRDDALRREIESEFAQTLQSMRDEVRQTRQLPTPQHRTDIGWP